MTKMEKWGTAIFVVVGIAIVVGLVVGFVLTWPKQLATPLRSVVEGTSKGVVVRVSDDGVKVRFENGAKVFVNGSVGLTNGQHVIVNTAVHTVIYCVNGIAVPEWVDRYVLPDK